MANTAKIARSRYLKDCVYPRIFSLDFGILYDHERIAALGNAMKEGGTHP